MSAGRHSYLPLPHDQRVLSDLLHSLSQPLTSLRCSLELTIEEVAEQQRSGVSAALQHAEAVIEMIQLMREYLDAEVTGQGVEPEAGDRRIALLPILISVGDELMSVAAVRDIRLRVSGTCTAKLRVTEQHLRLALQYLITAMIERQEAGDAVNLLLSEGPAAAILRARGEGGDRDVSTAMPDANCLAAGNGRFPRNLADTTTRRTRLAIAARVFERAGAELTINQATSEFVLRMPRAGDGA
jgi:hypothetical protein